MGISIGRVRRTLSRPIAGGVAAIAVGSLLQGIAYTTLPVFALYYQVCLGPYGVNPLPCATLFRTPALTAVQLLQLDGTLAVAFVLLFVAGLGLVAGVMRPRWLKVTALVAFIVWSVAVAVLIAANLPAPGRQNALWYTFLGIVAAGSVAVVAGAVRLWRAPATRA